MVDARDPSPRHPGPAAKTAPGGRTWRGRSAGKTCVVVRRWETTGHTEHADVQRPLAEPSTAADRQGIDGNDVSLVDACLPPRPRGYV